MDKESRQAKILDIIKTAKEPISASKLGQMLNVSRQLIVGDIALLRATGEKIFATPRGYLLESKEDDQFITTIACRHTLEEMLDELNIIVDEGGEVIDVVVSHPIYGELKGNLYLSTRHDVRQFMDAIISHQAPLLSDLSNGIHLHTIKCQDMETIKRIELRLKEAHLLYEK